MGVLMNLQNPAIVKPVKSPVPFVSDDQHQDNVAQLRSSLKFGVGFALFTLCAIANAALPAVDTTELISYIGVLVVAVSTVASATLMIFLAAKGIKALRTAF